LEKDRLIVLSDHYLTFVKDQIESVSGSFLQIDVLVRYNPVAEISRILPIDRLRSFRKSALVDLTGKPDNVTVHLVPVFFLPLSFEYKALGRRYYRIIERYLKSHGISGNLIHAHFLWPNGYAAVRLKEKSGIPCIVTAHGYDIYDLPFRDDEWRRKIQEVLDSSDAIVSVSKSNTDCIRKIGTKKPVFLIPNGFRNDIFHPMDKYGCRKSLGLPQNSKILVSVGNFVESKGYTYLVSAMARLQTLRSDVFCCIIGRGPLRKNIVHQVRLLNLEEVVCLPGGIPHHEIPRWLNACDILVFPSLRESFGVVQIEAMACGKPVVATINGGSEEIVSSSVGILARAGDSDALAEAISSALDSPWDKKIILNHADRFSLTHISKELLKLYSNAKNGFRE
jgi:glycosyltransferase involved in cell wall biosynthesis